MMERKSIKALFVCILPFFLLFIISKTFLKDVYLFEWTARRCYCGIWIVVCILVLLKQRALAYSISAGNVFGVVFGQMIGDQIIMIRSASIKVNSTPKEVYFLKQHYGVLIWVVMILLSIIVIIAFKIFDQHIQGKRGQ